MGGTHAMPWWPGSGSHAMPPSGRVPWMPPTGGPPGTFRPPWGGPKVPRGNVRAAVLALLAEEPHNGYQIIQKIVERSGGMWRPSAGSVYPALQQLEDEGLVRAVECGARRMFELTRDGGVYVEEHADELAAPWKVACGRVGRDAIELRDLLGQVTGAAVQVVHAGSSGQAAEARRVLAEARRSLYRILAEDHREPRDTRGPDDSDDAESRGDGR